MKVKLHKQMRIGIIIGLAIIAGLLSVSGFKEYRAENKITKEKTVCTYIQKPSVTYEVYTRPNILYDTEKLPEGQNYLSEFISHVVANFSIKFSGDLETNVEGTYETIGIIQGYMLEEKEKQIIWRKEIPISKKETLREKTNEKVFNKQVKIDMQKYSAFAKNVVEASKVSIPVELLITVRGRLKAVVPDQGEISQPIETSIVIPLGTPYFNVTKQGIEESKGEIKTTEEISQPPNMKKVILDSVGSGVVLLLLLGTILFTTSFTRDDKKLKAIKKIMNNHGSRLVAIKEPIEQKFQEVYHVNSIEDLVKIADELEKPILYVKHINLSKITVFQVIEGNQTYIYNLEGATEETVKETEKQETTVVNEVKIDDNRLNIDKNKDK